MIGSPIKEGRSVRFYVHYKQVVQIVDFGLENILRRIIAICLNKQWSDTSANKLKNLFGNDDTKGELAMAILEG